MKNLFLVAFLLFVMVITQGCVFSNTTICAVETSISNNVATALSSPSVLNCNAQGYATIQAKVASVLEGANVCAPQGIVGTTLCPAVESAVLAFVQSKMPAGCSPATSPVIAGLAQAACAAIPFAPTPKLGK